MADILCLLEVFRRIPGLPDRGLVLENAFRKRYGVGEVVEERAKAQEAQVQEAQAKEESQPPALGTQESTEALQEPSDATQATEETEVVESQDKQQPEDTLPTGSDQPE